MLVGFIFRMNGLHFTYGSPALSVAYICYVYLQNPLVTIHLWVRHLRCSLTLYALAGVSLRFTTLMGVKP